MKTKLFVGICLLTIFFILLPEPPEEVNSNVNSKDTIKENSPFERLNLDFIISDVRLYDGNILYPQTDILIEKGVVKKIAQEIANPNNLPKFEAKGKTLLPGFIDSHTHAYADALKDALNFGVTTELDMFTMPEFSASHLKIRNEQSNTASADLFSSTILATTTGGHGTEYGFDIPVLNSVQQVEDFVQDRLNDGADYIKAVYNSAESNKHYYPSISKSILAQLITSAHAHKVMLVVHIDNLVSAREAIELGADGIVHSFMDAVVDDTFIALMKRHHAFIIPTLSVEASLSQNGNSARLIEQTSSSNFLNKQQRQQLTARFPEFGVPKIAFKNALTSVNLLAKANVPILAGTDAPNPGTSHGISLHGELQLLVDAGLSNQQAIHSATGAAREFFPIGLRGTLRSGALASMILVDGNPFEEISDSQKILAIWKNGHYFKRTVSAKTGSNQIIYSGMINNFDKSIKDVEIGRMLMPSSDQFAGGKSSIKLSLQSRHSTNQPNNQYLQVKGELKKGFMFPWSGFSLLLGARQQKGVDLSHLSAISFDAKSTSGINHLSVLLFQSGSFRPLVISIDLTEQWQHQRIPLTQFGDQDLTDIANISIVNNKQMGSFQFSVDDFRFE